MNDKEKALHYGKLLLAEEAGETIQFHTDTGCWDDIKYLRSGVMRRMMFHPEQYRIKPKTELNMRNQNEQNTKHTNSCSKTI